MMHPEQWHPVDGLVLEPNATTAATMLDQNVVVAAGPGAGKTELLAQRADFVLRTGCCPYPRRILAVSFKVDAARNLRDRVRSRSGPQLAARFDSLTFHAFAKHLIDNFRPALTGFNALDAGYRIDPYTRVAREQITFDDLVPLALAIVETNAYANGGIRQTYSHVFLDEFQDCTGQQYRLIKALFGRSSAVLTAVGDAKQRIMLWAGALDGVMKTFAADFSAKSLPLYQNRRSAPRLRRMQNRMIAQMDPSAVSPDADLVGDDGVIEVCKYESDVGEAQDIADLIEDWLDDGVAPEEIAIIVRQQPHLIASVLGNELTTRGIPFRNERESQDLTAEPAASLVFNFIRVVADDRQPRSYGELMRMVNRMSSSEDDAARFDSRLKRMLQKARERARDPSFSADSLSSWGDLVREFLQLISRPVLTALSSGYRQGGWLDQVIDQALHAFGRELAIDGDAVRALRRLSEVDAIRLLTIHKCKGLEFEKVVVLGVEEELFWGNDSTTIMSEFFVAISRAKHELVLTCAERRERPEGATGRWYKRRTPERRLLAFALEA